MKNLVCIFLCVFSLTLLAQNESLFSGTNFSSYYVNGGMPFSGTDEIISDGAGTGTFTGGTFDYTVDSECNLIFVEDFGTETHTYIGTTDPSGEYAILIPDPSAPEGMKGQVTTSKLSSGKNNASFTGEFITSYYRYDSPTDMFVGLFLVSSNGIDACTYHELMSTATSPTPDETFSYVVDGAGIINLSISEGPHVITAAINESEDFYTYASIVEGFQSYGNGVKNIGESTLSEIKGMYKAMQIRYSESYGEESSSLISINLNEDGTGTYQIDTNSHGEKSGGTLVAEYQTEGIWEITLDESPDHIIYCAINRTERLITGYFNFEGESPGIIFGISKEIILPSYTVSGSVSGVDTVTIHVEGDVSETIEVAVSGGTFSFEMEQSQSAVVTPQKEGYTFSPESISVNDIHGDESLENFVASINTYTISGTVSGADDVLISMSGDATGSQTISEGEEYNFIVEHGQSVTITPSKNDISFEPAFALVSFIQRDVVEPFTAKPGAFTLSGRVLGADAVLIRMSGDATDEQTIDQGSTYSFMVDQAQSFTITPSKEGFTFIPLNITINNVQTDSVLEAFTATINTYSVSGSVSGADGVLISLSGDISDSQTIDAGTNYSFTVDHGQSIEVTPSKNGFTFDPASISLNTIVAEETEHDFVASPIIDGLNNVSLNSFRIYPNPATEHVSVEGSEQVTIQLLDLAGKILNTFHHNAGVSTEIDLLDLTPGLYVLKIIGGNSTEQITLIKK